MKIIAPTLGEPAYAKAVSVFSELWTKVSGTVPILSYEYDDADVDLFGLVADMRFNAFHLTPWAIVGHGGKHFDDVRNSGPTTSGRMDPYAPMLLDAGLKMMIGKGNRSAEVIDAIVRNRAVYFAAMGGAGALMGSCVDKVDIVCYEDLGCEAIRRLEVKDMPLTVAIDSRGENIYSVGPEAYLKSLED